MNREARSLRLDSAAHTRQISSRSRIDRDTFKGHFAAVKIAKKSPPKRLTGLRQRATLTLSAETYRKIENLRGSDSRAAWVQQLVEKEESRVEKVRLNERLRKEYTPEVSRQTLAINEELPIHES
jgi:hypothetical protein